MSKTELTKNICCHYINVQGVGKVLIPGCWGVAVHNDMAFCTCDRDEGRKHIYERLEKLESDINKIMNYLKKYGKL